MSKPENRNFGPRPSRRAESRDSLGTRQIQLDVPAVRKGHIASTEISIDLVPMLFLDLVSLGGYSGSPVILEATGHMLCR